MCRIPLLMGYGFRVFGFVENVLDAGIVRRLTGLLLDGIAGGVGAVLGFVPQMLVLLFILLAFWKRAAICPGLHLCLTGCSASSVCQVSLFIPMLIGTGCGVPGVMASRTIENERDRRMTIMATTFIPCGAKLPIIALLRQLCSAAHGG